MKNKIALLIVLLLVFSVALFGCGNDEPQGGSENGQDEENVVDENGDDENDETEVRDTLRVAISAGPNSLDGNGRNDNASWRVRRQIYDTLVTQNVDMEVEPMIAESWEYIDDVTIHFTIRDDIQFHNGDKLTAHDVAFSIQRGFEMGYAASVLNAIDFDKSSAIDDYTYELVTQYPFAPILANLSAPAAGIVPKNVVEAEEEEYLESNPIGTGPYMFDSWERGDRVELVKNPNYWGEEPTVERIVMRIISEGTNRAIELETGGVDVAYDISPNDLGRIDAAEDTQILRGPDLSTTYIGFNAQKEMFSDNLVRQAVAYALDLSTIADAVYEGTGMTAQSVIAPTVWGYDESVEVIGYDPERARELLDEAGYPDGLETTIWTSDSQERTDLAEIMQNALGQVGIDADVRILEWGSFLDALQNQELDIFILGASASSGDGDVIYTYYHSESPFSANTTFYKNPELDELLEASRSEIDPDARFDLLVELQQIAIEESVRIPVWHGENITGARSDVQNVINHPSGTIYLEKINF